MLIWLPSATAALEFGTALIGFVVAGWLAAREIQQRRGADKSSGSGSDEPRDDA
ncbi:hypothetical protein [Actinoplanes auranticolor]|uniref:Uncharacterized protein n=1 Tax=Actinoplanes auranticolor TaxID=47988 RepID=A0A919S622_9ACTN|nr:hypothetical protein [Actinoplanes auranticolor]GIM64959.1 hypothetical protein Aau02nite_13810 [Actinoplanes auranticolor]